MQGVIKATLIVHINDREVIEESVEIPFQNGTEFFTQKRIEPFLSPFTVEKNAIAEKQRLELLSKNITTVWRTLHSSQE